MDYRYNTVDSTDLIITEKTIFMFIYCDLGITGRGARIVIQSGDVFLKKI